MSATRKSKVNESLGRMLSKNNSTETNESPEKDDQQNVTRIDSGSEIAGTDFLESDPFTEAEKGTEEEITVSAEPEPEAPVLEVQEQAPDKVRVDKPKVAEKAKPEKIRPKKLKTTSSKDGGSKTLSGAAIGLSLIAILGSGYSILSQSGIQEKLAEGIASVESSIADITDRTDLFQSNLSSVKQTVSENSAGLSKLDEIQVNVREISQAINMIQEKADQVSDQLKANKSSLDGHDQLISSLQADVKKLNARPKPVARKAVSKPAPKKKPVVSRNSIEGATLATVDRWGASSYVMLRTSDGVWVPLQRGDMYKGWRFTGFTGEKALFKKGSTIKKLTLES